MVDDLEQRIYALVRKHDGVYLTKSAQPTLTPDTDFDTDLSMDEDEAEELIECFFAQFGVNRGNFHIRTYYPDVPISLNPFKKTDPVPVPDFTIGMLIESAKAGKWLYD